MKKLIFKFFFIMCFVLISSQVSSEILNKVEIKGNKRISGSFQKRFRQSLRSLGRQASSVHPLRRTFCPPLARRCQVRGYLRLRQGHAAPKRLALQGLGHTLVQRRQALCPIRAGTSGGRCPFPQGTGRYSRSRIPCCGTLGLHRTRRGSRVEDRW